MIGLSLPVPVEVNRKRWPILVVMVWRRWRGKASRVYLVRVVEVRVVLMKRVRIRSAVVVVRVERISRSRMWINLIRISMKRHQVVMSLIRKSDRSFGLILAEARAVVSRHFFGGVTPATKTAKLICQYQYLMAPIITKKLPLGMIFHPQHDSTKC